MESFVEVNLPGVVEDGEAAFQLLVVRENIFPADKEVKEVECGLRALRCVSPPRFLAHECEKFLEPVFPIFSNNLPVAIRDAWLKRAPSEDVNGVYVPSYLASTIGARVVQPLSR